MFTKLLRIRHLYYFLLTLILWEPDTLLRPNTSFIFFSTYEAPASDMCCLGLHFLMQFSEVTNTMGKSGLTVKKTYSAVIRGTVMLTWSSISSRKSREGIPANSFPLTFLHQAPPLTAGPVVNMVNEVWNCCFFFKGHISDMSENELRIRDIFFFFCPFFF